MTTPLPRLHSAADVAEAPGPAYSERWVKDQCRRGLWPHRRGPRGAISFSDDDYARVLELIAAEAQAKPEPRMSFAPRSRQRRSA